jgi:8-amino-7-oxononanoate synthase
MLDFTSSLYLGLRHPSHLLAPWRSLTTGKPAALGRRPCVATIAGALATLQGCERGTLFPSTLHLFFDLFEELRQEGVRIYVDRRAYPIAVWAVQRIAALGVPVNWFRHFDAEAAQDIVERDAGSKGRPVILTDGYCIGCGRRAPIKQYLDAVIPQRGYVVLDDTQALGIWGERCRAGYPYGAGGGGSLRRGGIQSPHIILGNSLAKGFGVPLAVAAGAGSLVRRLEERGETRSHSSPPSAAVLSAAARALAVNAASGDIRRNRLAALVMLFRGQLQDAGLPLPRSIFPVQALDLRGRADPVWLRQRLAGQGITSVVVTGCDGVSPRLMFILNARHEERDIERCTATLATLIRKTPGSRSRTGDLNRSSTNSQSRSSRVPCVPD